MENNKETNFSDLIKDLIKQYWISYPDLNTIDVQSLCDETDYLEERNNHKKTIKKLISLNNELQSTFDKFYKESCKEDVITHNTELNNKFQEFRELKNCLPKVTDVAKDSQKEISVTKSIAICRKFFTGIEQRFEAKLKTFVKDKLNAFVFEESKDIANSQAKESSYSLSQSFIFQEQQYDKSRLDLITSESQGVKSEQYFKTKPTTSNKTPPLCGGIGI